MAPSNTGHMQKISSGPKLPEQESESPKAEPQKMQAPQPVIERPEDVGANLVEPPKNETKTRPALQQGLRGRDFRAERQKPKPEESISTEDHHYVTTQWKADPNKEEINKKFAPPEKSLTTKDIIERANRLSAQLEVADASFEPGSLPANVKFAVRVARRWQSVPDNVSDMEALAGGFLTPEMLQLILTIVMAMMQDCLPNQPAVAWKRIQNFSGSKPLDRLGDETRIFWLVDRWFSRMATPRDKGDVRLVAKAIMDESAASSEEEFRAVQTEALWLTV